MKTKKLKNVKNENLSEFRIANVPNETINRFEEIRLNQYSGDKKKTFEGILDIYRYFNLKLSDEDKVNLKYLNETVPDIFVKKIKRLIESMGNKLKNPNYDNANTNIKNSSKSAFLRVEKIVEELAKQNDTVKEWFERKYINQKTIFEFAKNKKLQNPKSLAVSSRVIKQYLSINKNKIDGYNKKYDMSANHNLKAHYENMKNDKE